MDESILSIPLQELGLKLFEQLNLNNDTDLLSRWMAYQLASDLQAAAQLPPGQEKTAAEKRLHDLILQLWQHRQNLPSGRRPFESFDPLFDLLDRLHPDSSGHFYVETYVDGFLMADRESDEKHHSPMQQWMETGLKIDRVARTWLAAVLQEMVKLAEQPDTQNWVEKASSLAEKNEGHVIQVVLKGFSDTNDTSNREAKANHQFRIQQIKKRLEELSEFDALNKRIVQLYTDELKSLEGK